MNYIAPPSWDKREIDYPPEYSSAQIETFKRMGIKFINWNNIQIAMGPGLGPDFFTSIKNRVNQKMSVVIGILGGPGEGKSWFALRLCEIFDKKFNPKIQIIFKRKQLLDIITKEVKLKTGQAVMIDEAHMSTGARHWNEAEQKEFVDQIAAIRSRGLIVIIVSLHVSMIDKIIREFVLTYEVHMEKIGEAIVYEKRHPKLKIQQYPTRIGTVSLQVPGKDICPSPDCIGCNYLGQCTCIRAVYEVLKQNYLMERAKASSTRIEQREKIPLTDEELCTKIREKNDLIEWSNRGTPKVESIYDILNRVLKLGVKRNRCTTLAYMYLKIYPEVRAPDKSNSP